MVQRRFRNLDEMTIGRIGMIISVYNTVNQGVNSYPAQSGHDDREGSKELKPNDQANQPNAASISSEALALSQASEKVDNFIAENGKVVFELTIKGLKESPESLSAKLDDDSIPTAERREISQEVSAREFDAFAKYSKQSPPDFEMFFKKFVEYFDSLSVEDQQSERYKGLRSEAVSAYQRHARENGSEVEDLSFIQDPILSLFDALQRIDFNVDDTEKFRQSFETMISPLFDRVDSGDKFKEDSDRALERFDSVQEVIDLAKSGDLTAFEALENLANDSLYLNEFLNYGQSLIQLEDA